MNDITPAQLHILQHSLGLDQYGRGTFCRNYFATGSDCDDYPECLALCGQGLLRDSGQHRDSTMHTFYVTEQGLEYVVAHSPAKPKRRKAKV